MKIYCLLIDAMPLVDEIKKFADDNGFTLSRQIGNCFTTPTLYGMFTGGLPSDLLPGGIGFHSLGREDINKFKWFHDKGINIIDILKDHNYTVNICGNRHPFIARDILCLPAIGNDFTYPFECTSENHSKTYYKYNLYEESLKKTERFSHVNMFSSNPNGTNDLFWEEYNDINQRELFYKNEESNIKLEQEKSGDIFCLWQNLEWSDYSWGGQTTTRDGSIQNILRWLNFWDTDEQDSYFWIFSDHGDSADDIMSPKSYLSWTMTKDNTKTKNRTTPAPIISHTDFYKTILDKINHNNITSESRNIYQYPDHDRLYYIEDSRMHSSLTHANVASVVKIIYEQMEPIGLIQVAEHLSVPEPYSFSHRFDTGLTVKDNINISNDEFNYLHEMLSRRISWL